MKIADLRAKSKEELKELVLTLKKEQFNLRMQRATGALENQGRFKEVRKTIAQAKTLMVEEPRAVKAPKAKKEKAAAPAAEKKPAAKKAAKPKKDKE